MTTLLASRPMGLTALPARSVAVTKRAPRFASLRRAAEGEVEVDNCDDNIGEFCSIDDKGARVKSRTVGEMEQEYIAAMQAWYYDGKPTLTDEEFDTLKDELLWNGSKVPVLSSDEARFLEAAQAYNAGKPIMDDGEFDDLKKALRQSDSVVTQQGPRCSLRSKNMYSDAVPDYAKMTLLNVPAVLAVLSVVFVTDFATGFNLTQAFSLPKPWGIVLVWGLVLPSIYAVSSSLTNLILPDGLILKGQCPNCGTVNQTYFGGLFNVQGNLDTNKFNCIDCGSQLACSAESRQITYLGPAPPKKKAGKKKAGKKKKTAPAKA